MTRQQPRSPLFPYTTLFRSLVRARRYAERIGRPDHLGEAIAARRVAVDRLRTGNRRHIDRKSTRLNSSHANISYAVFCLKKKKTAREPTATHASINGVHC